MNEKILANYNLWQKNLHLLDLELQLEFKQLNKNQIEDAFFQNLDFGTGGLRGLMGVGPNRINKITIAKTTLGLGQYLLNEYSQNQNIKVAISYDNRKNSYIFAYEAAKILAALGIKSIMYKTLMPTPLLSYLLKYESCQAGIMITASHNPKEYNGYKVYNETGAQLDLIQSTEVIKTINKIEDMFTINKIESNELITYASEIVIAKYLNKVKEISINKPIRKEQKIVYSPLHGTGAKIIPEFLRSEGYNVFAYYPQMVNDDTFPNLLSSNPEDQRSFLKGVEYADYLQANTVLVTDPDADRLGVAIRKKDQTFYYLNGNETAALILHYLLSHKKNFNKDKDFVFSTIVTSDLLDKICLKYQVKIEKTLTGFKFIGEKAALLERNHQNYLFGCEESYGSLISDFVRDKDAVQACYLLCEMINYYFESENKTLLDKLADLDDEFGAFVEYTHNIELPGQSGLSQISQIMETTRSSNLKLNDYKLLKKDDYLNAKSFCYQTKRENKLDLPASNVLKFYYSFGWIVLRPSGTEPKLKIYFSVSEKSSKEAYVILETIREEVLKILQL